MMPLIDCTQKLPVIDLVSPARYQVCHFFTRFMKSLLDSFMNLGNRELWHTPGNNKNFDLAVSHSLPSSFITLLI